VNIDFNPFLGKMVRVFVGSDGRMWTIGVLSKVASDWIEVTREEETGEVLISCFDKELITGVVTLAQSKDQLVAALEKLLDE
jgi:hypothetical protein